MQSQGSKCGKRKVKHERMNTNTRGCITVSSTVLWSTLKRHSCTMRGRSTWLYAPSPSSQYRESTPQNRSCDRGREWDPSSYFCFSWLIPHTSGLLHLALWTAPQKAGFPNLCCAFHPSLKVVGKTWNTEHGASQSGFAWATEGWEKLPASSKRQEPCRFEQRWLAIEASLWTSP